MRIRIYQDYIIKDVEQLCKQTGQSPTQVIISLIKKEAIKNARRREYPEQS